MNNEANIERYVDAWKTTASLAKSPALWLPLALLAALKILLLVIVYFFWHPLIAGFAAPTVRGVFGEEAIHYPAHILRLPGMFSWIDIAATMTVGFILIGWSVVMMFHRIGGRRRLASRIAVPTIRLVPAFFLLGLIYAAGVKGVMAYCGQVSRSVTHPKIQLLLFLCGIGASLACRGLLAYALPYLVLWKGRVFSAIGKSVRYALRWSWLTAMIVLTAGTIQVYLEYVLWRPGRFLQTSGPGSVFAILVLGVIIETLGLFYLSASATSIVLDEERQRVD